jgi:hypothetical protein
MSTDLKDQTKATLSLQNLVELQIENEALRSQLALLGGAAVAAAWHHPGLVDVLKAIPYLRTLPAANEMIEALIKENEQ